MNFGENDSVAHCEPLWTTNSPPPNQKSRKPIWPLFLTPFGQWVHASSCSPPYLQIFFGECKKSKNWDPLIFFYYWAHATSLTCKANVLLIPASLTFIDMVHTVPITRVREVKIPRCRNLFNNCFHCSVFVGSRYPTWLFSSLVTQ